MKIDLNQYQYEVKDEEQEFVGFGKDLVILYIVFNEQSFKSFLSEINLNKFDSNKLGIYDYALTLNYEDIRMSLLIDVNNKTLKYTYFHR